MKKVYPIIIKQNEKDFLVFIPDMERLNEKAEAMGLNFSKVLQNALMEQVGEQN